MTAAEIYTETWNSIPNWTFIAAFASFTSICFLGILLQLFSEEGISWSLIGILSIGCIYGSVLITMFILL